MSSNSENQQNSIEPPRGWGSWTKLNFQHVDSHQPEVGENTGQADNRVIYTKLPHFE